MHSPKKAAKRHIKGYVTQNMFKMQADPPAIRAALCRASGLTFFRLARNPAKILPSVLVMPAERNNKFYRNAFYHIVNFFVNCILKDKMTQKQRMRLQSKTIM